MNVGQAYSTKSKDYIHLQPLSEIDLAFWGIFTDRIFLAETNNAKLSLSSFTSFQLWVFFKSYFTTIRVSQLSPCGYLAI